MPRPRVLAEVIMKKRKTHVSLYFEHLYNVLAQYADYDKHKIKHYGSLIGREVRRLWLEFFEKPHRWRFPRRLRSHRYFHGVTPISLALRFRQRQPLMLDFYVDRSCKHFEYLQRGTKPHVIIPRRKQALRIPAKGTYGRPGLYKRVLHPGIKPQRLAEKFLSFLHMNFRSVLQNAWEKWRIYLKKKKPRK